ncbi:YkvA family protein [Pontibacter vulgaris]|uniref:YkvA family protein n=1 Tax=Pontibacter vulgaris TaxID=2905679 RepID=UPI001FA74869|nr:YkvA family protein [Pontibacter vulgaris]
MENQQPDGKNVAQSAFFKGLLKKAERYLQHPMQVTKLLNDAFKKATAKKNIGALAGEVWENLQLLSRLIKSAVAGEYKGIPTTTLVGGIAVIIYFLSPIDLIPDIIPVIGLLDDASLLAWFMTSIKAELDRFKEWDAYKQEQERNTTHTDPAHHADSSFGTPKYSNQPPGTVHSGKSENI